ncbi:MAG: hypothetical protein HOH80_05045 [Rhodospirillaceae bacterium]|jgi:hypothetical protein|nr:hypothetical protein [Rhodospirillaceae bacterium]MBT4116846.1 hypothetical protein [Rhodospirillaceae bacterium]MBT4672002.1 hypothetical protein [Rhodospirillaceae bacterium]MBT5180112.1 hypothetical protein [Rhodospirillaceae bacterium]MBT5838345.1 hypothetical protein [Rhodospirillaceae bacterium]
MIEGDDGGGDGRQQQDAKKAGVPNGRWFNSLRMIMVIPSNNFGWCFGPGTIHQI